MTELTDFPYFCQWESAPLAEAIVLGKASPLEDPLWAGSGADSVEDYGFWSSRVCGMACLKMILAARDKKAEGTIALAKKAMNYGVYVRDGDTVKGMIYAPFEKYVHAEYGIESRTHVGLAAHDVFSILDRGSLFIASVHPTIRWPEREPPSKGGHLVLVTGAVTGELVFNNPSGHTPETQRGARLSREDFDRFFAGRGVEILPEIKRGHE